MNVFLRSSLSSIVALAVLNACAPAARTTNHSADKGGTTGSQPAAGAVDPTPKSATDSLGNNQPTLAGGMKSIDSVPQKQSAIADGRDFRMKLDTGSNILVHVDKTGKVTSEDKSVASAYSAFKSNDGKDVASSESYELNIASVDQGGKTTNYNLKRIVSEAQVSLQIFNRKGDLASTKFIPPSTAPADFENNQFGIAKVIKGIQSDGTKSIYSYDMNVAGSGVDLDKTKAQELKIGDLFLLKIDGLPSKVKINNVDQKIDVLPLSVMAPQEFPVQDKGIVFTKMVQVAGTNPTIEELKITVLLKGDTDLDSFAQQLGEPGFEAQNKIQTTPKVETANSEILTEEKTGIPNLIIDKLTDIAVAPAPAAATAPEVKSETTSETPAVPTFDATHIDLKSMVAKANVKKTKAKSVRSKNFFNSHPTLDQMAPKN